MTLVCPYCDKNEGFNTGKGNGQLTCSNPNCGKTFDVDRLVEKP